MVDLLPTFHKRLGVHLSSAQLRREMFTFPLTLHIPGWCHRFDLMLRKALSGLPFFPQWLERLKALTNVLRVHIASDVLCKYLVRNDKGDVAATLGNASIASWAHWRWTTLWDCQKSIMPFLDDLLPWFNLTIFGDVQDRAGLIKAAEALSSQQWRDQFDFVFFH